MDNNLEVTVDGNIEDNNNSVVLTKEEKLEAFKAELWIDIQNKASKEIIEILRDLDSKVNITNQKEFYNEAKDIISLRSQETKASQLEKFIAEGGVEEDFKFVDLDYVEFNKLNKGYKEKRTAFYKNIEDEQNSNLKKRHELITQIIALVDGNQDLKFSDFSEVNDQWKSIGRIPASAVENVFKTYQHHVERFFDLLSINRDLKDIEFNRNLKFKEELCAKAEALVKEEDVFAAVNKLQDLHRIWKEQGGPVQKEQREVIWDKFNSFTSVIHDRRQEAQNKVQEEMNVNFEKKMAIVNELNAVNISEIDSHAAWKEQIERINNYRTEWNVIGRVSKEQNAESWEAFKEIIKTFNTSKK